MFLDTGVVNRGKWSETSKAELRVPFEIKECNILYVKPCSNPALVFTVMGSVVV